MSFITNFLHRRPRLGLFIQKVMKDNIGFLASAVAWSLLTSVVPVAAGVVAISSLFLRDPASQRAVIDHLSFALQGALQPQDITSVVKTSIQHSGIFWIIGILGVFWGGSNVGGAISTVFQAIFEVNGRDFLKEKLLDVAMIFVFVALMIVIIVSTTAGALITRLFPDAPIPGGTAFIIGTIVSLAAAYLLFAILYLVFPNTEPRFKLSNIWGGSLTAAVLFQALSFVWPLYSSISHFSRYSAVIAPIIVLTAWIYFFSIILVFGAEIVAFKTIREANRIGEAVGPRPENVVPAHTLMRDDIDHVATP